jgi:hypothetical protein
MPTRPFDWDWVDTVFETRDELGWLGKLETGWRHPPGLARSINVNWVPRGIPAAELSSNSSSNTFRSTRSEIAGTCANDCALHLTGAETRPEGVSNRELGWQSRRAPLAPAR